jgi:serine/threonine protein kinase
VVSEAKLVEMLLDWEDGQSGDTTESLEKFCGDSPDVLDQVRSSLADLKFVDAFLEASDQTESDEKDLPSFPGYATIRELGRGGMGVVYAGRDRRLGRKVALKVVHPDRVHSANDRDRFLREARAMAAVQSERVMPIFHVGVANGLLFIVMPLLDGETLADRLGREVKLSPSDVIRIGRDMAEGLAAVHVKGLIHRDLKPANVWLEGAVGRAKLLDFGLAADLDRTGPDLTAEGAVIGTASYMSPEQANGKPLDARSDLFSLGTILYEMATGKSAFRKESLTATLMAVSEKHPLPAHKLNPSVPTALSAVVMRLLCKNPTDRPASAELVAKELAAIDAGQGDTQEYRPRPSHRALFRAVVVVGVLIALSIGFWQLAKPGPNVDSVLPPPTNPADTVPPTKTPADPVRYRGQIDVLIEREINPGTKKLVRLDDSRALPLMPKDKFRIEGTVDPPAFLYLFWIDPGGDVTAVYPWNPREDWGPRPTEESATGTVSLPTQAIDRYTAQPSQSGVSTFVLFARSSPLEATNDEVKAWFVGLPDLPLPPGGERVAVWFDNYVEARDPGRMRTFGKAETDDPFARWQGQLQKVVGSKVVFQTAVSFARMGRK